MRLKFIFLIIIIIPVLALNTLVFYKVSGKIYKSGSLKPASGVIIELYTSPNGQGKKIIKLKSDKEGNFNSDKSINFSSGLYPVIKYKNSVKYMKLSAKTGNCMLCHTKIKLTVE